MSLNLALIQRSLMDVSEQENERLRNRSAKEILHDRIKALEQELAWSKQQLVEEFHEPEPVPPEDLVIQKLQEQIDVLEKQLVQQRGDTTIQKLQEQIAHLEKQVIQPQLQEKFQLLESFVLNYIRLESEKQPYHNDSHNQTHYALINTNIRKVIDEYRDRRQMKLQRKYKLKVKSLDWSQYFPLQTSIGLVIRCSMKNYCIEILKKEQKWVNQNTLHLEDYLGRISLKEFGLNQEKDKENIFIFTITNEKVSIRCNDKEESFLMGDLKGNTIQYLYNNIPSNLEEIFE